MTAALFRTDAFDRVGLLNEALESYYEDVEWGLRAAALGLHGVFVPHARATHTGSATLGKGSARATFLISRNQVLALATTYPSPLLYRWWWPILWGNLLYLLACLRRGRGWAALRGKLAALRAWPSLRGAWRLSRQSHAQATLHVHQESLRVAILKSEARWRSFIQETPGESFWRLYFAFTPPLPLPARNPGDPKPA
jgi:GT2 family glycosyltransferase